MDFHQLSCFLAVVEEGSFNRAATRLHKTQPAISYQIKQLESELSVQLLHRAARRIIPTQAGQVLAEHAREVVELLRRSRQAVAQLSERVAGEIRIGTVNSVGIHFLPDVLRAMNSSYPLVRPTLLYRNSPEIMSALLSNRLDLALVSNPPAHRKLQFEVILKEKVSLVVGPSHPFHGRDSVRPNELEGVPFISLTTETPTGEIIRDFLQRLGLNVDPVVFTDNVETVKKMVEVGIGVAFLPDMVTSENVACDGGPPGILSRVEVGPPLTRSIVLVTWKHLVMTPAVAAFIEELRTHARAWRGCLDPRSAS